MKFHRGDFPSAIEDLRFVERLADECEYDDLRKMTRFYLARALLRVGAYEDAKREILTAQTIFPQGGATFDLLMTKACLVLNEEGAEEATTVLKEAEQFLLNRDYVDQANVKTAYGRFARQQGDFDRAAECARHAIGIFEENDDHHHLSLARAHLHLAFALLLKAQNDGFRPPSPGFEELRSVAFGHLREAQRTCGEMDPRILDRLHYFKAAWYFYLGDVGRAKQEVAHGYESAEGVSDYLIMAHCRILQVKCARFRSAADDALRYAMEADYYAQKTDNRRICIRALIWRAVTEADPPRRNRTMAKNLLEQARNALRATDRDYLRWEFDSAEGMFRSNPRSTSVAASDRKGPAHVAVSNTKGPTQFSYDVAISFAGEQREQARLIAGCLRRRRVNVFFDEYEQANLWGEDLYEHLSRVYQKQARYCLMLVSRAYADRVWTSHKRKSAQARALNEKRGYILPVRFDEIEVPGLAPTIA